MLKSRINSSAHHRFWMVNPINSNILTRVLHRPFEYSSLHFLMHCKLDAIGPFIRAKISRGLNKSRTTRINSQFAISRGLFRPSFQLWAYFSRGLLQIDCLYESFATYLSRGLFRPIGRGLFSLV
jgi:hypothetical protein